MNGWPLYCVIGVSEDTLVLNNSFDVDNVPIGGVYVITPDGRVANVDVSNVAGAILEVRQILFFPVKSETDIPIGSLAMPKYERTTVALLLGMYRDGMMNPSIEKVMKRYNITTFEMPTEKKSQLSLLEIPKDNFFDLPDP